MFREFNLKGDNEDEFILYKNRREQYGVINSDYVENISYKFLEPFVMTLKIPNKVNHKGELIKNEIYYMVKGKRQLIEHNRSDLYVITEMSIDDDLNGISYKNITATKYESTLDGEFAIGKGGLTRHIYKKDDNEVETSDGVLNMFVQNNKGWSIGHIDENVRKEFTKLLVEYRNTITSVNLQSVKKGTKLFDKDISINPLQDNILDIKIVWRNLETYNGNNLMKKESLSHNIGKVHTGIVNIKATYLATDDIRHCIRYDITLNDGVKVIKDFEFTPIEGMNITCGNIEIAYTNGTVEDTYATKYRSFEEGVYQWYDFLTKGVADAFDCIFIFDTANMVLNCYEKKTYGVNKGLYLSYENFIKSINKTHQLEEVVTMLEVQSENEGITISEDNPLGTEYILNYDYFVENEMMSNECSSAYERYLENIEGKQVLILQKRSEINTKVNLRIKKETENIALAEEIKGLEVIRVGYIKANDEVNRNRISREINLKQDKISILLKEIQELKDIILSLRNELEVLMVSMRMESATDSKGKIFTDEDLEELQSLTIKKVYTDKYYLTNYGLYTNSVEMLKERNKLQIDFTLSPVALLERLIIPKDSQWNTQLSVGDFVNIEDDEIKGNIRVVGIEYSPKNFSITNISFSNKDKDLDALQSIGNIGRAISRTDNYISNYKQVWNDSMNANDFINGVLGEGLDLKASIIRSRSERIKTSITESGIYVIDAMPDGNENNQIYISSSMICATRDRWNTSDICIDANGVAANMLIGRIVMSQKLFIENGKQSFRIDENGIYIKSTDGEMSELQSYFNVLHNEITLGVKNAIDHTDSQIKLLDNKIELKVDSDGVKSIIQQNPDSVKIGFNGISPNIEMNMNGISITNGGLTLLNRNGTVVIDGTSNIFKIQNTVTLQLDAGSNMDYTYTYYHGLGYTPVVDFWQVDSPSSISGNTHLPAIGWSGVASGAGMKANSVIRGTVNENYIYITYLRDSTSIRSDFKVKFHIFVERLL